MKASTKIKKYVHYDYIADDQYTKIPMVLMVDGKNLGHESYSFDVIDIYHHHLITDHHCTLLPINECPVCNGKEIIRHYTSTTYKDWCNLLVK